MKWYNGQRALMVIRLKESKNRTRNWNEQWHIAQEEKMLKTMNRSGKEEKRKNRHHILYKAQWK